MIETQCSFFTMAMLGIEEKIAGKIKPAFTNFFAIHLGNPVF
jgi:hypothetical protein